MSEVLLYSKSTSKVVYSCRSRYRGTSLTRKRTPLGPYSRITPRALLQSWGVGHSLVSEVPLYTSVQREGSRVDGSLLQGYLAYKKQRTPRTLQ